MSKQLNELFELDESLINPPNPLSEPLPDIPTTIPQEALNLLDRINDALPQVRGLDVDDRFTA